MLSMILAKGVFMLSAGGDHMANTYFNSTCSLGASTYHPACTSLVVAHAAAFLNGFLLATTRCVAVISLLCPHNPSNSHIFSATTPEATATGLPYYFSPDENE